MGSSACRPSSVIILAPSDSDDKGVEVEHAKMAQLPGKTRQPFGKQVLKAASQPQMWVMQLKTTKTRWWSVYKTLHRAYKLRKALVGFWLLSEG